MRARYYTCVTSCKFACSSFAVESTFLVTTMNLEGLKSDWDSLAGRDALWAILTDPSKVGGGWDIAEFMATGEAEIETVMSHLVRIDAAPNFSGAALDFGCGVGRLTQPLAQRFASCIGVDISEQMIRKADALNQYEQCRYVASSETLLPFADASFSFIYCNIVLQHMPRAFSEQYLQEFLRVLERGGVLVFGVQDSFVATDISSRMDRIRQILRIRSRVREMLGRNEAEMQMHLLPEPVIRQALWSARLVDVQFTNTAAKDFNGKLVYLRQAPRSGYVSKQYCAVKPK